MPDAINFPILGYASRPLLSTWLNAGMPDSAYTSRVVKELVEGQPAPAMKQYSGVWRLLWPVGPIERSFHIWVKWGGAAAPYIVVRANPQVGIMQDVRVDLPDPTNQDWQKLSVTLTVTDYGVLAVDLVVPVVTLDDTLQLVQNAPWAIWDNAGAG